MANGYVYDKNSSNEYELIESGEYEVTLEGATIKTYNSGNESLSLKFRIRNDVEQRFKNRIIFEDIWQEKENRNFFNRRRINQLLGTQSDIKDGKEFESIDDVIKFLRDIKLIAVVDKRFNDYTGKDENFIKYYKSSNVKAQVLGNNEPITSGDIADEDLPF